jgi:UDP:flavonoid glycosyltransferase YjiC (YdhE family)
VLDALSQTQNRAIILSGWSDLRNIPMPDTVLIVDAVPHDWLLPRCKAVVHHGGAGTTAAGLRAGIPNLVVSSAADQPFWGKRVYAIGAGPRPIPVRRLTVNRLSTALVEADGKAIRAGAQAVGRKIRMEDGVERMVRFVEKYPVRWREMSQSGNFKV